MAEIFTLNLNTSNVTRFTVDVFAGDVRLIESTGKGLPQVTFLLKPDMAGELAQALKDAMSKSLLVRKATE